MTADEFAGRMVGVPWVRWREDWSAVDCFGLVSLYHRHVLMVDPGPVPHADIASGFASSRGWEECGASDGSTAFMLWRRGAPTHCGVVMPQARLLHAQEGPPGTGSVRITRLAAMARACQDMRFYRFTPC